ncbi:MAG TPA: hypothetical protein VIF33_03935, partial [Casimicrobiaceae bacterium]
FVQLERLDDRGNQFHEAFPDMDVDCGWTERERGGIRMSFARKPCRIPKSPVTVNGSGAFVSVGAAAVCP